MNAIIENLKKETLSCSEWDCLLKFFSLLSLTFTVLLKLTFEIEIRCYFDKQMAALKSNSTYFELENYFLYSAKFLEKNFNVLNFSRIR